MTARFIAGTFLIGSCMTAFYVCMKSVIKRANANIDSPRWIIYGNGEYVENMLGTMEGVILPKER